MPSIKVIQKLTTVNTVQYRDKKAPDRRKDGNKMMAPMHASLTHVLYHDQNATATARSNSTRRVSGQPFSNALPSFEPKFGRFQSVKPLLQAEKMQKNQTYKTLQEPHI